MRRVDRPATLLNRDKVHLIKFRSIRLKINRCCVISLAQYRMNKKKKKEENIDDYYLSLIFKTRKSEILNIFHFGFFLFSLTSL